MSAILITSILTAFCGGLLLQLRRRRELAEAAAMASVRPPRQPTVLAVRAASGPVRVECRRGQRRQQGDRREAFRMEGGGDRRRGYERRTAAGTWDDLRLRR